MFIPVIRSQGTPEQLKMFLHPAERCEIIGCYAQTEMGHGSNLSKLETTATFIKETDEFEIHSPTLTATKWWAGGLGVVASHALLQAKLIIDGKDYGVQPFVVPIRSLKDHKPLPGVTVGDIGPKFGFAPVDNGYLRFDHYRIPRINMLQKYAKVDSAGNYSAPIHDKIAYGGMVLIRAQFVHEACIAMARSSLIATRYAHIRRQFSLDEKAKQETQIIDYSMVQNRLFPLIAKSFALFFTGQKMMSQYYELQGQLVKNDVSMLAEVHAFSSGLKSYTTTLTAEGIEEARRLCGGHGYSMFSGLPLLFSDYVANYTMEGDNYLLTQQITRYLLKLFAKKDEMPKSLAMLYERKEFQVLKEKAFLKNSADVLDVKKQNEILGHRLMHQLYEIRILLKNGMTWNEVNVEASKISQSFSEYAVHYNFVEALQDVLMKYPKLHGVLKLNLDLYFCEIVIKSAGDFLVDGFMSAEDLKILKSTQRGLIKAMRPNALALVEAYGLPEYMVDSVLGREDGKVYENMFKLASEGNPANELINQYETLIKPVFQKPNSKF